MQHDIFLDGEADNWYDRNEADVRDSYKGDIMLDYLQSLTLEGMKILDVGCGNGHRLAKILDKKKGGVEAYGIEPSAKAVNAKADERLNLFQGVSHDLSRFPDEMFDIVTVAFVFHWVDRAKLLKTVSEIDRVLKNRGLLAIADFFPTHPQRRTYHRNPELGVYTYKQNYPEIFRATNIFQSIYRMNFIHPNAEHHEWDRNDINLTGGDDHGYLEVFKKDYDGSYPIADIQADSSSPLHR